MGAFQYQLPIDGLRAENPEYLTSQLVTCIGNKRSLLGPIEQATDEVRNALGKERLRIFDAFAGSGVVSRLFMQYAETLYSSDLEAFSVACGKTYLRGHASVNNLRLAELVNTVNQEVDARCNSEPNGGDGHFLGFIEELYAPRDDEHIGANDRVFYTRRNARRLDVYSQILMRLSDEDRSLLLGPLISEASIHANTAGVFKGFYKDRQTGVGRFGGSNSDALSRILGEIRMLPPVFSQFNPEVCVQRADANEIVKKIRDLDLVYLDPPYNQHPYGSNYFMLNLLVDYRRPVHMSRVSGIPSDWNRSQYNVRSKSFLVLQNLIQSVDAKFVLLSFSDEGFVSPRDLVAFLTGLGSVSVKEITYNTFRGSRNLRERSLHVKEHLFLLDMRSRSKQSSSNAYRSQSGEGRE